jgi:endonuclease/exonuclease/phosphatase family metal-dependent hydrolase
MKLVTQNCQRNNEGLSDNWAAYATRLLGKKSFDFVLLQEVGAMQGGGTGARVTKIGEGSSNSDGLPDDLSVDVYSVDGRSTQFRFMQFSVKQVGIGGNAVNLCIASRHAPIDLGHGVYHTGVVFGDFPRWRPILVATFESAGGHEVSVGSIHAISGGGTDAPALVGAMDTYAEDGRRPYIIGGDFNREPASMAGVTAFNPNLDAYPPGHPTFDAGRTSRPLNKTYDYFISNVALHSVDVRSNKLQVDHLPVEASGG